MKIGLWFVLLALATVGLYFAPPGWQAQRVDVLIKPQDEPARLVWSLTPEAKLDLAEENPVLFLRARGVKWFSLAQMTFTPAQGLDHVFVGVDSRAGGLQGKTSRWPQVGVLLHALDRHGQRLGYWPYRAVGRNGDHDWTRMQGLWPIPAKATHIRAIAYLLADAGEAQIRALELDGGKTRPAFAAAFYAVVAAWFAFGLYCAHRALKGPGRRPLRVATVTLAASLVAVGVAPQPYMYESVRSVAYTAQDAAYVVVQATRDWLAPTDTASESPDDGSAGLETDADTTAMSEPDGSDETSEMTDGETSPTATLVPPELESSDAQADDTQSNTHEANGDDGQPPMEYWEPGFAYADKAAHLGAFLVLAICIAIAWSAVPLALCIVSAAGISATIQILQTMTVTREFDWWDFGADLTGIVIGSLCVQLVAKVLPAARLRTQPG